jgi:predicted GIY-YIG superfamily endonuclease
MTIVDESAAGAHDFLDEVADSGRTLLYRLYDADDELLYIGITDDPAGRMRGHAGDKDWWPEVARKTAVWYQYRAQAETAETIAIGLEQPKHNKAKRYIRLPEQQFPDSTRRPVKQVARRPPVADPPITPDEPEHELPWPPPGHWCWTWWQLNRRSYGDTLWEWIDIEGPVMSATEAFGLIALQRRESREDGLPRPIYWAQDDSDYIRQRGITSWSAHFDSNRLSNYRPEDPNDPLESDLATAQSSFLEALVAAGRCTHVRAGIAAVAYGFEDQCEAQIATAMLHLIAWGHVDTARACTDILRGSASDGACRRIDSRPSVAPR